MSLGLAASVLSRTPQCGNDGDFESAGAVTVSNCTTTGCQLGKSSNFSTDCRRVGCSAIPLKSLTPRWDMGKHLWNCWHRLTSAMASSMALLEVFLSSRRKAALSVCYVTYSKQKKRSHLLSTLGAIQGHQLIIQSTWIMVNIDNYKITTFPIISKSGVFSGREVPFSPWLYHLTSLSSYDFIVHVNYQIHLKYLLQANYCTRESYNVSMTLQREAKHLKMKDAKRCGKKRKAASGNLHWSGDDHFVNQQVCEGQVIFREQCSHQ